MQWQSKPWRRWNHVLHLCSSCLSSTTTTSCVGSLHCTDWSLPDCRLVASSSAGLQVSVPAYRGLDDSVCLYLFGSRLPIACIHAVQSIPERVLSLQYHVQPRLSVYPYVTYSVLGKRNMLLKAFYRYSIISLQPRLCRCNLMCSWLLVHVS